MTLEFEESARSVAAPWAGSQTLVLVKGRAAEKDELEQASEKRKRTVTWGTLVFLVYFCPMGSNDTRRYCTHT